MLDNQGMMAKLRQFDAANGGDPVIVNGWLFFRTGASREQQALGAWIDPSPDARKRTFVIAEYWKARLRLAVQQFEDERERLVNQAIQAVKHVGARTPPFPPSPDEEAGLERLLAIVRERQADLDKALSDFEAANPKTDPEREARIAATREANEQVLNRLRAIKV